jgi:hypothetical protein
VQRLEEVLRDGAIKLFFGRLQAARRSGRAMLDALVFTPTTRSRSPSLKVPLRRELPRLSEASGISIQRCRFAFQRSSVTALVTVVDDSEPAGVKEIRSLRLRLRALAPVLDGLILTWTVPALVTLRSIGLIRDLRLLRLAADSFAAARPSRPSVIRRIPGPGAGSPSRR